MYQPTLILSPRILGKLFNKIEKLNTLLGTEGFQRDIARKIGCDRVKHMPIILQYLWFLMKRLLDINSSHRHEPSSTSYLLIQVSNETKPQKHK